MTRVELSPFCIACMNTEELFHVQEQIKQSSDETFSSLLKNCFDLEVSTAESLQYICKLCSYRLLDALDFKEELQSTLEALLEVNPEDDDDDIMFKIENVFSESDANLEEEDNEVKLNKPYNVSFTKCLLCEVDCKSTIKLRRHLKEMHPDRYICHECPKAFVWQSHLIKHQKQHQLQRMEQKDLLDRRREKRRKAPTKPKKPYSKEKLPFTLEPNQTVCALCHAEFTLPRMLAIHMHDHYPLHVCEQCGKGYATKTSLRRHKTTHLSGPFTCKHCGKVCKLFNSLLSHTRLRHSQRLLYPCRKCGERFATSLRRIQHCAQAHGDAVRSYKCQDCHKRYLRYVDLLSHIQSRHVPEGKRTCSFCSKTFADVNNLGRHIRNIHKLAFSYKEHSNYKFVDGFEKN